MSRAALSTWQVANNLAKMTSQLFTPDYKDQPYWWDRTPRPALPETSLPAQTDVAIVGSGYTGLCAALQTARGGRHTIVLDAHDAGWGL